MVIFIETNNVTLIFLCYSLKRGLDCPETQSEFIEKCSTI